MIKNLCLVLLFLLISGCNNHEVLVKKNEIDYNLMHIEKPFEIQWIIQKKSITTIPTDVFKNLKIICKEYNKIVLTKIKTFENNTAIGTFECRI